jgi:hypothetical protein
MEFRWIAFMALWTILSGPIFGGPSGSASRVNERPQVVKVVRPLHQADVVRNQAN